MVYGLNTEIGWMLKLLKSKVNIVQGISYIGQLRFWCVDNFNWMCMPRNWRGEVQHLSGGHNLQSSQIMILDWTNVSRASILLVVLILPTQEQFYWANANFELFVPSCNLEADGLVKYSLGLGSAYKHTLRPLCSKLLPMHRLVVVLACWQFWVDVYGQKLKRGAAVVCL